MSAVREHSYEIYNEMRQYDVLNISRWTASSRDISVKITNASEDTMTGRWPLPASFRLHPVLIRWVREQMMKEWEPPTYENLPDQATEDTLSAASKALAVAVANLATEVAATAGADTRKLVRGDEWIRPTLDGTEFTDEVNRLIDVARKALKTLTAVHVRFKLDGAA